MIRSMLFGKWIDLTHFRLIMLVDTGWLLTYSWWSINSWIYSYQSLVIMISLLLTIIDRHELTINILL